MKGRVLKTVCAAVLTSALLTPSYCQNYYIVIGAFASEKEDIRQFTSHLPGSSHDTSYTINSNNNLLHLYVLKTSSKELAIAKTQKLQEGIDNKEGNALSLPTGYTLTAEAGSTTENKKNQLSRNSKSGSSGISASKGSESELATPGAITPAGKFFKFVISSADGSILPGEVHQVDLARGRELRSFSSNNYVSVPRPGKNQPMTVVCGVFGYKEINKFIDYSDPSRTDGAYLDEQGAWVIRYKLERLEKGDVSVMYDLSFYKDAVVMLPASKKNLDELVNMMKFNPNYSIKVHAHCNGKNSRKIIAFGNTNNYFNVKGSIEQKSSAKELTYLRGLAVRSYLIDHGIDLKRIKIQSWGGNDMLVGENSSNAKLNDRVEIEILKD